MLRAASVNPILLFLAQRVGQRLVVEPSDSWQGMGGLRRENMDPDRSLDHWTARWPDVTRRSLEEAWGHPLMRASSLNSIQPDQLAQALLAESTLDATGRVVDDALLLPWSSAGPIYSPLLMDRMLAARDLGQQVWLVVSPSNAELAASEPLVQTGLNLGISWFLLPPTTEHEREVEFPRALRAWTRVVLQNPRHDQWVGLWCELFSRMLFELAQTGQLSRRTSSPEGWPRCEDAHWSAWTRVVMDACREVWPAPAQLEDVCLGLLQPTCPPLAEP